MTIFRSPFRSPSRWRRLGAPPGVLALGLIAGLLLSCVPPSVVRPLKDVIGGAIRPSRVAGERLSTALLTVRRQVRQARQTAAERQAWTDRFNELQQENEQLRRRLIQAGAVPSARTSSVVAEQPLPLLRGELVTAHVLGNRARQRLAASVELDQGQRQRLSAGDLAMDVAGRDELNGTGAAMPLDIGRRHEIQSGQLVLNAATVCGKVVEVGRDTSWLLPVTATTYRDEVLLLGAELSATSDAARLAAAPRGVLEGTGDGLCRVRLVDVSAPVAVGDMAYAGDGSGVWQSPPRYGTVIAAERTPGAAHWQITVRPDAVRLPAKVAILRLELSPLRMARRDTKTNEATP